MQKKLILLCALIGLITLNACGASGAKPTPTLAPTPVVGQKPTYTVARGDVSKVLELRGRVVSLRQQEISFGADGYVQEVLVSRGDVVKTGDVLARLEPPEDYESKLAAAQLAYEQAKLDLASFKLDLPVKQAEAQLDVIKNEEELKKANDKLYLAKARRDTDPLRLEQARASLQSAQTNYNDALNAYNSLSGRPETDPDRQAALGWLIDARRQLFLAQSSVNYLTGKPNTAEVARAEAELAVAQAKYDRAVASLEIWNQEGGPLELRLAEAKVAEAQAKVDDVIQSKADAELIAPFDGQIISLSIAQGDQVTARKVVATLADPASLEISVIPTAQELADMGVGQKAVIRLSSQQGKDFSGQVRLLPDPTGKASEDASARLVLDDPDVTLTLNEAATVIIEIETRPGVLWLPPAALRKFQGQDFVLIEEDGIQRRIDIRIGLRSADRIEIVGGLEEGQIVIGP